MLFKKKQEEISEKSLALLMVIPTILILGLVAIYPFVDLVVISFMRYTPFSPPYFVGFKNFIEILGEPYFYHYLINSLIYTFGSLFFSITVGLIIALCLNRVTNLSSFFRTVSLLPFVIPIVVVALVWRWLANDQFGLINLMLLNLKLIDKPVNWLGNSCLAMLIVTIADGWMRTPFAIIIFLAGLKSIPKVLYEASKIDGASSFSIFRYITMPWLKPAMMIVCTISTMFAFRTFGIIFTITDGGPGESTTTFPLYIHDLMLFTHRMGKAASLSIIVIVFILIFITFYSFVFKTEESYH